MFSRKTFVAFVLFFYVKDIEKIATVTKKGVIKAKGRCTVYVYTQNGISKKNVKIK